MCAAELRLGTEYSVVLTTAVTGREWECQPLEVLPGWIVLFASPERRLHLAGDVVTAWVFASEEEKLTIRLTDSDRGRLPISSRMRPRYVVALRQLIAAESSPQPQLTMTLADAISESKGMANRAIRKDQWDWLSVRRLFGDPDFAVLCSWRDNLGSV